MGDARALTRRFFRQLAVAARMDLLLVLTSRAQVALWAVTDLVAYTADFTAVLLLAQRFGGLVGWSKAELLFLFGFSTTVWALRQVFFNFNVGAISRRIGRGQLDHTLVQPQPMWLSFATEGFNPFSSLGPLIPGVLLLAAGAHAADVAVTPSFAGRLAGSIAASIAITVAASFAIGAAAFWAPRGAEEISTRATSLLSPTDFPLDPLPRLVRTALLSIVPAGFVAWFPRPPCSGGGRQSSGCSPLPWRSWSASARPSSSGKAFATMHAPAPRATPPSDIAVELSGVVKTYRQRQRSATVRGALASIARPTFRQVDALKGVDLTVRRGETIAYAGPNGAGKSTTIKLLAGILGPDAGSVRVFGRDPLAERRHHVARIGVVFGQRTELWHDHPVRASFDWKRVVWDVPDERYHRMLGALSELLDLDELMPALARELSLGQRMRAELGLALLHEPDLLLLDEPTIGLDVLGKRRVLGFVKELRRFRDVTVVVTSHDMSDLEQLAERIVMVDRGRIAFDGDFTALRRTVSTRRRLVIETASEQAPDLAGAELVESLANRHSFVYDPASVDVAALIAAASAHTEVLDVETHRPDIDDVVADIYEHWRGL